MLDNEINAMEEEQSEARGERFDVRKVLIPGYTISFMTRAIEEEPEGPEYLSTFERRALIGTAWLTDAMTATLWGTSIGSACYLFTYLAEKF